MRAEDVVHLLDALLEGIQFIGPDWRYLHVNEMAARHGRRRREELLGKTMMECYPGIEQTALFATLRECMTTRRPTIIENRFTYPDGTVGDFELRVEPVLQGLCILSLDVTERRRAAEALERSQEQLRHAQKMEVVGRLAGGIAHDFNNILSVVLSCAELGLLTCAPSDPLTRLLEEIRNAGRRAAGLTHQLLAYSRRQVMELKPIDLNLLLNSMTDMIQRLLGADVQLILEPFRPLWTCKVDVSQIEQVVMNLVVNARDAMPRGGKLTIETANAELDAAYAQAHANELHHEGLTADNLPGEYVMLAITDTGEGMNAATRSRLFEPFFTTKSQGRGTGLGLATVLGIVRQSRGFIWVYSEVGQGTTFKIYLPRAQSPAEQSARSSPAPVGSCAGETVLVVEDDNQLRQIVVSILTQHGYRVLAAANPETALATAEQFAGNLDLLLTDVVMPKMNGRQLAQELRARRPSLRVLYMTGYTENAIVHHGILEAGVEVLQKPITPDALLRRVREVLSCEAPRG